MRTDKLVTMEILEVFTPLDRFDVKMRRRYAKETWFETLQAGEVVMRHGSNDSWVYYLVSGEVSLTAPGRDEVIVKANSDRARQPLNDARPCRWTIHAVGRIIFFRINDGVVRRMLEDVPMQDKNVANAPMDEEKVMLRLVADIERDVDEDKLKIPSLPDVVLRVQKAVKDRATDVADVAKIVMVDPPLVGRLIKVANSPMYRGNVEITSCQIAISRMGLHMARDMVVSCSLQQMFDCESTLLKKFMQKAWEKSTHIAALCAVISRHGTGLDEDRAMLAGLVHDIGALPIINYAACYPELAENEQMLERVIKKLGRKTGIQVLHHWEFDSDMVDVVRSAQDWKRDSGPKPDYCDVVQLAQLYSYIDTPLMVSHPAVDEIPAFNKFSLGALGPEMTLRVLESAQADIDAIEKVLQG